MPILTVFRGSDHLQPIRACLTVLLLAMVAGTVAGVFQRGVAQSATFEPTWYMVIDRASLLDESQERSAINDTWRLNMRGVPAQVVTEISQSTPELARQRANDLLVINGIESSSNAGDGVLIYAAVDPANRSHVIIGIGVGPNALPQGGLTTAAISDLQSTVTLPYLANGHPARAIVYSVREMLYLEVFVPPPSEPLSGWRSTLHSGLTIVAPVLTIATIAGAWWLIRSTTTFRGAAGVVVATLGLAFLLGVLSVSTRSTVGAFSAITLLATATILAMTADRHLKQRSHRILRVSPRPAGHIAGQPGGPQ